MYVIVTNSRCGVFEVRSAEGTVKRYCEELLCIQVDIVTRVVDVLVAAGLVRAVMVAQVQRSQISGRSVLLRAAESPPGGRRPQAEMEVSV